MVQPKEDLLLLARKAKEVDAKVKYCVVGGVVRLQRDPLTPRLSNHTTSFRLGVDHWPFHLQGSGDFISPLSFLRIRWLQSSDSKF